MKLPQGSDYHGNGEYYSKKRDKHMNDKIKIYDSLFDHTYRVKLFNLAQESLYKLGWGGFYSENTTEQFLFSLMDTKQLTEVGICRSLKSNPEISKWIGTRLPKYGILNCDTHADVHTPHSHTMCDVILYYMNMDWKPEWYGETLFYSEDLSEIILSNIYTPGRVVCFDGEIPHSIRPNSRLAPKFRHTLSIFFEKLLGG